MFRQIKVIVIDDVDVMVLYNQQKLLFEIFLRFIEFDDLMIIVVIVDDDMVLLGFLDVELLVYNCVYVVRDIYINKDVDGNFQDFEVFEVIWIFFESKDNIWFDVF